MKINFGENTMFGLPPRISNEFSQYQLLNSNVMSDMSQTSFAASEVAVAQDAAWI